MQSDHDDLQHMRERRNEAQAELERFLLEQYPIDSVEKNLGVAKRSRAVTEIEEQMRDLALKAHD